MKLKSAPLLALLVLALAVFAGCAQDSTNTTDDNPEMQEQIMKGEGASAEAGTAKSDGADSNNPTRTEAQGGTGGNKLALSADPSGALKFNKDQLNANAGNITIAFVNESSTPHDVTVDGDGKELGATKEITKSTAKLDLEGVKAGSYTFFCSVPGHEQAGMKGTLTVK